MGVANILLTPPLPPLIAEGNDIIIVRILVLKYHGRMPLGINFIAAQLKYSIA